MPRRRQWIILGLIIMLAVPAGAVPPNNPDGIKLDRGIEFIQSPGPNVTVDQEANITTERPWKQDNTLIFEPWVTLHSNQNTSVNITRWSTTAGWTNLTAMDVSSSNLTVAPNGSSNYSVVGPATEFSVRDPSLDDGQTDFHIASSGSSTVTIRGLPANTDIEAVDGSDTVVATDTTNGTGVAVISLTTASIRLQSTAVGTPTPTPTPTPTGGVGPGGFDAPTDFSIDVQPLELPVSPLILSDMDLSLIMLIIGLLGIELAAAAVMQNFAAGATWSLSVVSLLLSGLLGIGLEIFWIMIISTAFLLMAGMLVRYMEGR